MVGSEDTVGLSTVLACVLTITSLLLGTVLWVPAVRPSMVNLSRPMLVVVGLRLVVKCARSPIVGLSESCNRLATFRTNLGTLIVLAPSLRC